MGTNGSDGEKAVTELIKNNGIINSLKEIQQNPEKYLSDENKMGPFEIMIRNLIDFAGKSCTDTNQLSEIENKISKEIVISANGKSVDISKTIKLVDKSYKLIKENPHFVQYGLYSGSLISYGLVLRALRNGYTKSAFPEHLSKYHGSDRILIEQMRAKEVRIFTLFSIPFVACSLLLMGAIGSPKFTMDVLNSKNLNDGYVELSKSSDKSGGSSIVKSSFFFIMKDLNKKWLKYVIFTILFILIIVNYCLYDLHLTYYLSSIYLFLFRNLY